MATRIYIVPVVLDAKGRRVPKYFYDGTVSPTAVGTLDYGFEPRTFVGSDLSTTDQTTLAAKLDVISLPADLTTLMTAPQVTAAKSLLEVGNIPADWLTTSFTWLQALGVVCRMSVFLQRFSGIFAKENGAVPAIFGGSITPDSTFGQLPLTARTAMQEAAMALFVSTDGITGATTLRVLLKLVADRLAAMPISLEGITI